MSFCSGCFKGRIGSQEREPLRPFFSADEKNQKNCRRASSAQVSRPPPPTCRNGRRGPTLAGWSAVVPPGGRAGRAALMIGRGPGCFPDTSLYWSCSWSSWSSSTAFATGECSFGPGAPGSCCASQLLPVSGGTDVSHRLRRSILPQIALKV